MPGHEPLQLTWVCYKGQPRTTHPKPMRISTIPIHTFISLSMKCISSPLSKVIDLRGTGENRTHDKGFAVLGLTTWQRYHALCFIVLIHEA